MILPPEYQPFEGQSIGITYEFIGIPERGSFPATFLGESSRGFFAYEIRGERLYTPGLRRDKREPAILCLDGGKNGKGKARNGGNRAGSSLKPQNDGEYIS